MNVQFSKGFSWHYRLCCCIVIALLASCSAKKEVVYVPTVPDTPTYFFSDIIVNYKLYKDGVQDTFNHTIEDALKGNFDIPEYDIKLKLAKHKDAEVEITNKDVLVIIPVAIQVEKQTFLANLKANGILEMTFVTNVDIDSIWNLSTKTNLTSHRWIEKPKLQIGGINLPIETIANITLKKTKTQIEQSIDASVKESFALRQKIRENLAIFEKPFQLDPSINAWFTITPEKISLSKITNSRLFAEGKMAFRTQTKFTSYQPNLPSTPKLLPKLSWDNSIPDSTVFRIVTDIKTIDINPAIKANLEGKSFTEGGKTITLSNIVTNCDYEYFRVVTDVSGSINGTLIIKSIPKYNKETNSFYMTNTDIDFKTKNVIHKAASWIAEGKIRKELESKMQFNINDYLKEAQKNLNSTIQSLNQKYDLEMSAGIGKSDIESFELKPGQIQAVLRSMLYFEVKIKDFKSFNKM